jgi:Cys-tRNA(Pro) deacylase
MTTADEQARIDRVTNALGALGHNVEMRISAESTHTAAEAATEAGCELGQIVKTLVAFVSSKPILALVAGDRKLNDRLLADRFGVGRKQIKLASAEQVRALTGYPIGGVSPFGMLAPLDALIDESFQRFDVIWLAGGTGNAIFPMPLADVAKLTCGEFAAIAT